MPGAMCLMHRTLRILQPRIVRRIARLLDLAEHVLHQLLEVGRPRDEVRFAVHFGEDAPRVVGRDGVADQAFARRAAGLLRGAREPALAEDRRRFVEVAVRLAQRVLALHHARAGLVAELLHHVRHNSHHRHCLSPAPSRGRPYASKHADLSVCPTYKKGAGSGSQAL